MVSFVCNACGQTVRKNQVEKHYQSICRSCEVLSCIDCGKDFHGNDYAAHTSCISEAEKYQGKLFKPKDKLNKGEQKQQEWIKQVQEASKSGTEDPKIKKLLHRLKQYSNIPRKKAKFQNFCKNSVNVYDQPTLDKLWDVFSGSSKESTNGSEQNDEANGSQETDIESKTDDVEQSTDDAVVCDEEQSKPKKKNKKDRKNKQKDSCEATEVVTSRRKKKKSEREDTISSDKSKKKSKKKRSRSESDEKNNGTSEDSLPKKKAKELEGEDDGEEEKQEQFNWSSVIKKVLRDAPDKELPIKKLRKKVLAEFISRGANYKSQTDNELRALFDKKIHKNPKIKVQKERAKLCT